MKKFFKKIGSWFQRHKPTKRKLIQLYTFLLYNANIKGIIRGEIFTGSSKYMCVPGLNCYSCPGAIGACPLGALQNALASSKTTTPFYVIGILVLFGLLFARTVCGFLCPIGFGQELLYKIRTPKLKKSRFTRIFSYLKYVILAVLVVAIPVMYSVQSVPVPGFCKYICPAGTLGGAIGLLIHPDNADMFSMLGPLFTWKFCVLAAICVASIFIFRFFCRFFCPLGALYGFFNKIALIGVKLDKNKCTDCGLCIAHCKMDVKRVGDHECINCGECIDVCPAHAISWKGSSLFVRNTAESANTPPPDVRPLDGVLNKNGENGTVVLQTAAAGTPAESLAGAAPVTADPVVSEANSAVSVPKKRRDRAFWLRFAAWAAALCVLIAALVYYNFLPSPSDPVVPPDPPHGDGPVTGNQIGNLCSDFRVDYYGKEGSFSVSESRGKVTVINFWATWCTPCVMEIPYFEEVYTEYSDRINVVAIHSKDITEKVEPFLRKKGWDTYGISFAQDVSTGGKTVYDTLGGNASWPMTVVLDAEGVIRYNRCGSVTYDDLVSIITPLLADG